MPATCTYPGVKQCMKLKKIEAWIMPDLYDRLARVRKLTGHKVAELIRRGIEEVLKGYEKSL